MSKVAIIGDIHGLHAELLELLEKLPADIEQVYTTGDLIDRGPDSKAVIQECIDRGIISVKGNHEDMFIDYIGERGKYNPGIFEMNGGLTTLKSYDNGDKIVDIPDSHLEYMINMPYYIETDDFILSHAGVPIHVEKTFRDCSERSQEMLVWDRSSKAKNLGKFQVFGHTPQQEVEFLQKWNPIAEKQDIVGANIDTAGCFNNKLSAIILPTREVISVNKIMPRSKSTHG